MYVLSVGWLLSLHSVFYMSSMYIALERGTINPLHLYGLHLS